MPPSPCSGGWSRAGWSTLSKPWESLLLCPQEAWEAFLAQGWEKTVFARPRPFVRPPHSSVFVRPRPCSQGLCLGRSSPGLVSED